MPRVTIKELTKQLAQALRENKDYAAQLYSEQVAHRRAREKTEAVEKKLSNAETENQRIDQVLQHAKSVISARIAVLRPVYEPNTNIYQPLRRNTDFSHFPQSVQNPIELTSEQKLLEHLQAEILSSRCISGHDLDNDYTIPGRNYR